MRWKSRRPASPVWRQSLEDGLNDGFWLKKIDSLEDDINDVILVEKYNLALQNGTMPPI